MPTARTVLGTVRNLYRKVFQREEDTRIRGVVESLRGVPILQHLTRSDLRNLAQIVHPRDYKRHELIYYENDPGLGLYFVQEGRVRLFVEDQNKHEHEVQQIGEGDLFGVVSLLGVGDLRRMETAQAVTETRVLGFFSPDLRTMLRRNPKTAAAVLLALSRHLALRQVQMVQCVADREGMVAAMHLLGNAGSQRVAARK